MQGERAGTATPRAVRRSWSITAAMVLASVALAGIWPALWARDGASALLGVGTEGPAREMVQSEIPDTFLYPGLGHDGQQFYAIARHPFDPPAARDSLESPAYRYRRIFFPAVAGALAPGGGYPLVVALLGVSLAGVALGAWAISRFPGAPPWMPLAVGLSPGVGVALALTLADALATGLVLATLAAAFARRWTLVVVGLTAAALTRETLLLVALGLALTPGLDVRRRIALVGVPSVALLGWMAWSTRALGTSAGEGSGQLSFPLLGWLQSDATPKGMLVGLLSTVVIGLGAVRCWRDHPGVSAVLGLHFLLMLVLATDVTTSWLNTTRVAAPVFAAAVWSIVRTVPAVAPPPEAAERSEPAVVAASPA